MDEPRDADQLKAILRNAAAQLVAATPLYVIGTTGYGSCGPPDYITAGWFDRALRAYWSRF